MIPLIFLKNTNWKHLFLVLSMFCCCYCCMWMFGLHVRVWTTCMPSACEGQKRVSGRLGLKLHMAVSHRIEPECSVRAAGVLNCWDISLAPFKNAYLFGIEACMCHHESMEIIGQLVGISSFLLSPKDQTQDKPLEYILLSSVLSWPRLSSQIHYALVAQPSADGVT